MNLLNEIHKKKKYLSYYIELFLNNSKSRNKKTTYSNYQYIVNHHIFPRFEKIKLKDIDIDMINDYTNKLMEEDLSSKYVKDILLVLNQILKLANIYIKINYPKIYKKQVKILSKNEQIKLEKYIYMNLNSYNFGILLSLYTGVRIGELCALKWSDIDFNNRKIYIKRTISRIKNEEKGDNKTILSIETPKTISSFREIPISDYLYQIMINIKKNPTLWVRRKWLI